MTLCRRKFCAGAVGVCLGLVAPPALADATTDGIVRQLRDQGYTQITVRRTFLGRSRVTATGPEFKREIVINPSSGEILRDYWEVRSGSGSRGGGDVIKSNPNRTSNRAGRDDDDDDDDRGKDADDRDDDRDDSRGRGRGGRDRDDDRDDDRDSDNSGKGSDNSGRGGGDDSDDD